MINFFRKIRERYLSENKTNKYLKYAIGEIILVVIGILIAIQINNWNDKRIKKNEIKSYAQKLILDLGQDIQDVKWIKWQAEVAYLRLDSLVNYTRHLSIDDCKNLDLYILTYNARYRPYSWNRASYEELKSTGILNYFNNDNLANLLVKYEAFTKHMEVDYEEDFELIKEANKLRNKVVNMNYEREPKSNYYPLITAPYGFNVEIIDYQKQDFYDELQRQPINFIDKNQKKLDDAINTYVELKYNFYLRGYIELPKLIHDAETIIKLLETSYLAEDIKQGKIKRYRSKELSELFVSGKTIDEIIDIIKSDDINEIVYDISRNAINRFGYNLMNYEKYNEALKIFKLNTELNSDWFTIDSYAEGLLKIGDTVNAIKAYNKSLELNPDNTNTKNILAKIK